MHSQIRINKLAQNLLKIVLIKLNPGVNFIKILRVTFTSADPQSAKKTVNLSVFFELSGSAHAKAASRTLMKLTPGI